MWCRECDRDRGTRDGATVAHAWDFEARLIADALIAIGDGATYGGAAERMRLAARRVQLVGGAPVVGRSGETVARSLDHFGELVLASVDHDPWPDILLLDALPMRRRIARADDHFGFETESSGAVLIAYGYVGPFPRRTRRQRQPDGSFPEVATATRLRAHPWRIAVAGGTDRFSWDGFLRALPGRPR